MIRKYIYIGLLIELSLIILVIGTRMIRGMPPAITIETSKVMGDTQAKTYVVVFSDFECPYCSQIRPTLNQLLAHYPHDLKIVFKHFPLKTHRVAQLAAEASECAADQEKFWAYGDYLFDHVMEWHKIKDPRRRFTDYAGELGLNTEAFKNCLESGVKKETVQQDKYEGRHSFVSGTPTCILNGKKVLVSTKLEFLTSEVKKEIDKLKVDPK